ncbi:helix-turn-helix transcriptional regulator [Lentzea sp. BCCO 10_0856]|uniref:Helix-turn-helix transcriptional regulator n=1 Tax=Lentzea miocenica TaxID=3095431 RepID=A0ABU4STG2_9PSEU|nr:helix-turn-helix transcriptional regulator [Lentzea sp. BCCO 10_0856]MDX8029097.1 helix-turn-helix transcriptional regulator [Lentzea sp. BCCO 10_0856]
MPRKERPLDSGDSAVLTFARELRSLRDRAGRPTYRQLSSLTHYSEAALSQAASGRKLPTLQVTLAYVRACGGRTPACR